MGLRSRWRTRSRPSSGALTRRRVPFRFGSVAVFFLSALGRAHVRDCCPRLDLNAHSSLDKQRGEALAASPLSRALAALGGEILTNSPFIASRDFPYFRAGFIAPIAPSLP